MLTGFWGMQPLIVRILLLFLFITAAIALARFVRLARRLCSYSDGQLLLENIARGVVDPDVLAKYALSNRVPRNAGTTAKPPTGPIAAGNALGVAEREFLNLCDICFVDVESTKRAAWLTFLLSLMTVAFGAAPVYMLNCNNSRLSGWLCLFESADQLLKTFGVELSICALLYCVSGFFEQRLSTRRASWKYFFCGLKETKGGKQGQSAPG
jgi:hypothetical protein